MPSFPPPAVLNAAHLRSHDTHCAFVGTDAGGDEIICRMGATAEKATALIKAFCSDDHQETQAGEGGFTMAAVPMTAHFIVEGNPAPRMGHFFNNGKRWLKIKSITSHPADPIWQIELEPLSSSPSA